MHPSCSENTAIAVKPVICPTLENTAIALKTSDLSYFRARGMHISLIRESFWALIGDSVEGYAKYSTAPRHPRPLCSPTNRRRVRCRSDRELGRSPPYCLPAEPNCGSCTAPIGTAGGVPPCVCRWCGRVCEAARRARIMTSHVL
jgi:hypothetical protein